jgi:hypothetical protein
MAPAVMDYLTLQEQPIFRKYWLLPVLVSLVLLLTMSYDAVALCLPGTHLAGLSVFYS